MNNNINWSDLVSNIKFLSYFCKLEEKRQEINKRNTLNKTKVKKGGKKLKNCTLKSLNSKKKKKENENEKEKKLQSESLKFFFKKFNFNTVADNMLREKEKKTWKL